MPDNRSGKIKKLIAVLGAICISILLIWLLSKFVESEFAIATLGFVGAVATASFQYRTAKDNETKARLFAEKQAIYTELTQTIMDLFSGDSAGRGRALCVATGSDTVAVSVGL